MKTTKSLSVAVAVISLGLSSGLNAQEAEGKIKVGDAEGKARIDLPDRDKDTIRTDRDQDSHYRAADRKGVTKINKASGILGMQVKNHLGENLGEIQDLVMDLPSGKISYAVLSVGGFLGVGEKYIAIPPSVFTPAPEGDKLVLHADKARIHAAPGFVKTQWPDLNNPNWGGVSFWQTDGVGSGATTIDRGTDRSTLNKERDLNLDANRDRSDLNRTDRDRNLTSRDKVYGTSHGFKGRITAINPETRTMTVTGDSGTMTFSFTDKPVLALKENRNPKLTDFKVGFPVTVGYHDEGGSHVAHSVIRTDSPEVR